MAAGAIEQMLKPMEHRGPDGCGTWEDGPVALGHLRLAILDPSARADQPMQTPDGRGVLVYNGEVFNYTALRRELEREGASFRSSGDTEVVLEALHRWGPERAIPRFDGMFAFAYLDRRDRTLWLARDRLGIKPLYVARRGRDVLFASEIKGLLGHPALEVRPDLEAIKLRLRTGELTGQRTVFEGIEEMQPGSWWKLGERDLETHRYFDPIRDLDVDRLLRARREPLGAAEDAFDALFPETVREHLASDVPIAAACSGGVDSSLIAVLARRESPDLQGYVAASAGETRDADSAQALGRRLGIPIERVDLDRPGFLRLLAEAAWYYDHPLYYPSSAALLLLTRACRAAGIKVLLTGEGADELFSGYPWHRRVHRETREARRRAMFRKWVPWSEAVPSTESAPDDPDAAARQGLLRERLARLEPAEDRALVASSFEDLYTTLVALLRNKDRMGMAASVETRVPFVSNAVIDFALHLPPRARFRGGQAKWLLKQVAARHLPRDLVFARKRCFPMAPDAYFLPRDLLQGGALAELFEWSPEATEAELDRAAPTPKQRFQLTGLEMWARIFLRGDSTSRLADDLSRAVS